MKQLKLFVVCAIIPNVFGFLGSLLGNSKDVYPNLIKPLFAPPGWLFPIVWIILYFLMGISLYLILISKKENQKAVILFFIQLTLNSLWTFFFFNLKWYLFSFIWIILIILFLLLTIIEFSKINKKAAYIQLPYFLWLIFACILNYNIFLLN